MDKKICPLMRMSGYGAGFNPDSDSTVCLEEKCAWWANTQCAILKLVNKSFSICK
jgi:hypothetical protein